MTQQNRESNSRPWPQELARIAEVVGLSALALGATLPALGCREGLEHRAVSRLGEKDQAEAKTAMSTYREWVDSLTVRGILNPEQARSYAALKLEEVVALSPDGRLVMSMEGKVEDVAALLQASDPGWRETFTRKGIVASPESALAQLTDSAMPLEQRIGLAKKWASAATAHAAP